MLYGQSRRVGSDEEVVDEPALETVQRVEG
jgi:hypothetical protein